MQPAHPTTLRRTPLAPAARHLHELSYATKSTPMFCDSILVAMAAGVTLTGAFIHG